jgi:23S rRNA-/tRNA-specific pseudouridylate synthase
LRVAPREGRQHQIRAHLAHAGHPIVGDHRYGAPPGRERGFLLRASAIAFRHPVSGDAVAHLLSEPAAFRARITGGA